MLREIGVAEVVRVGLPGERCTWMACSISWTRDLAVVWPRRTPYKIVDRR